MLASSLKLSYQFGMFKNFEKGQSMDMRYGQDGSTSLWDASFEKISTLQRDRAIDASTFLPDGRLILVVSHFPRRSLELIDRDLSQTLATLNVNTWTHDVSAVSNTEVIITEEDQYLQWINVSTNLTLGHKIDLGDGVVCHDVDVLNDEIYTVCRKVASRYVRVLSRHGGVLKQIDVQRHISGHVFYIKVGRNGNKVFLSTANKIVCYILYRFPEDTSTPGKRDFDFPACMYVDDNDNVLVSAGSDNIHIINNDGTKHKVLLDTAETGRTRPLSYRKADGLLVVGTDYDLSVYKARW